MKAVITYGTFDLFHYGHWNLLKRASKLGDDLFVFLSTDKFNSIKGKTIKMPFYQRYDIIESLSFVKWLESEHSWEQKKEDIKIIQKEYNEVILVMGDDWKDSQKFKELGCEVVFLPRTGGISSSKIKEILKNE